MIQQHKNKRILDNLLFTDKKEKFKKLKQKLMGEKVKRTFQLAGSSKVIDLNKPMGSEVKREDFPNTRSGAKAYQNAMKNMKDLVQKHLLHHYPKIIRKLSKKHLQKQKSISRKKNQLMQDMHS